MPDTTDTLPPLDAFDDLLDDYLFDAAISPQGLVMEGILPFAELEIAIRNELYAPAQHLERRDMPLETQIERLLQGGLVTLAKTAVMNGLPTDTALCGDLDKALYQACVDRLKAQIDRWQPGVSAPNEEVALTT